MFESFLANLWLLWPSSILGQIFVVGMILVFILSWLRVKQLGTRSKRNIKELERILNGQTSESLYNNISNMSEMAKRSRNSTVRDVWQEFYASLVIDHGNKSVFNSLDSSHFFNPRTLATGVSSSRLLAAAPSFLTAIGVLGTFLGLTIGLKGLHIDSNEIEVLKDGISSMINGAALAFTTSVWGVALSLALNVCEKNTERQLINKVRLLQKQIDLLIPRLPAERSLIDISKSSNEMSESIKEMHEKIGDRLQEAVAGINESMQEALSEIMGPALKTIANNANQQASGALEKLINDFMLGVKEAGNEHGSMIQKTSEEMHLAVKAVSTQMNSIMEQNANNQKLAEDRFVKIIGDQQKASSERESLHREKMQQQTDSWMEKQATLINSMVTATNQMQEYMASSLEQHKSATNELKNASAAIEESSKNMNTSSEQMLKLSSNLHEAVQLFDARMPSLIKIVENLTIRNEELSAHILNHSESLKALESSVTNVSATLGDTAKLANNGFKEMKHTQDLFLQGLKKDISDLQNQASNWLKSYSDEVGNQVTERMNLWNDKTREFSDQMLRTVSAINGIVDEMDSKIGRK